jgi:hypothetical protein
MAKTTNTIPQSSSQVASPIDHLALDRAWDRFDQATQKAAQKGKIQNAEPMIRSLNADMRVFSGLATLIEIVRNNVMLQDHFEEDDPSSVKPLTVNATDSLLGLAAEICNARSQDICGLADWMKEHIDSREKT